MKFFRFFLNPRSPPPPPPPPLDAMQRHSHDQLKTRQVMFVFHILLMVIPMHPTYLPPWSICSIRHSRHHIHHSTHSPPHGLFGFSAFSLPYMTFPQILKLTEDYGKHSTLNIGVQCSQTSLESSNNQLDMKEPKNKFRLIDPF